MPEPVGSLVDFFARNEDVYQRQLLRLKRETANINDFSYLGRLDDGKSKVQQAEVAIPALQNQIKGHLDLVEEHKASEKRRAESHDRLMQVTAVKDRLAELTQDPLASRWKGGRLSFAAAAGQTAVGA